MRRIRPSSTSRESDTEPGKLLLALVFTAAITTGLLWLLDILNIYEFSPPGGPAPVVDFYTTAFAVGIYIGAIAVLVMLIITMVAVAPIRRF